MVPLQCPIHHSLVTASPSPFPHHHYTEQHTRQAAAVFRSRGRRWRGRGRRIRRAAGTGKSGHGHGHPREREGEGRHSGTHCSQCLKYHSPVFVLIKMCIITSDCSCDVIDPCIYCSSTIVSYIHITTFLRTATQAGAHRGPAAGAGRVSHLRGIPGFCTALRLPWPV